MIYNNNIKKNYKTIFVILFYNFVQNKLFTSKLTRKKKLSWEIAVSPITYLR